VQAASRAEPIAPMCACSERDAEEGRNDGVAAQQRDKLRAERKREREREMRLENLTGKKSKYARDQVGCTAP
jgi:hypothetical protein